MSLSSERRWPTPRCLSVAILAMIALFAAAGTAFVAAGWPGGIWNVWNLDGERTFPAAFSAALLCGAGACGLAAGYWRVHGIHRSWYLLAVLFLGMGVDEAMAIHERLEGSLGVDWQILYAPVVLVCGVAWLLVTYRLRRLSSAWVLMVLAAAMWLVAQILEKVQWNGDEAVAAYDLLMVVEEILEMSGSALFFIAIYAVLYAARTGHPLTWRRPPRPYSP